MKIARIFLALLLLLPISTTAQLKDEYAWQVFLASDKKKAEKLYDQLDKYGYKYDLDSMRAGKAVVRFTDPRAFAGLYNKKVLWQVFMADSDTLELTGIKVKDQLFRQYLSSLSAHDCNIDSAAQHKDFTRMLKGKQAFPKESPERWYVEFGTIKQYGILVRLDLKKRKKYLSHIRFTDAKGDIANEFKEYEPADCYPVNRYLQFLSLRDLKDHHINPTPYTLERGKKLVREFRLTFDHNQYQFNPEEVQKIITYLEDSSLTIQRAYIRGMSSVEGDSVNNARLQRRRAEVLWDMLADFALDSIRMGGDYKEGWKMFRSQLAKIHDHSFDSLDNDTIRQMLNNRTLRAKYEPLLAKQRVARLRLNLYKTYTPEEVVIEASRAAGKYYRIMMKSKYKVSGERYRTIARKYISRILGVEGALINDVKRRVLTPEDVMKRYAFDYMSDEENLIMARFYHLKHNWDRGREPVLPNTEDILMQANAIALPKITSEFFSDQNKPLRKAVDIQLLTYRMIKRGFLEPRVFYQLNYDDDPRYYHLEMNKLYYNQHYLHLNERSALVASSETSEESYMTPEQYRDSRYYYYLKKWLVNGSQGIKSQVMRQDKYYFIDIYDLVYYNVKFWDPLINSFYDEDVTVEVMAGLLNQLQGSTLCPEQKYAMALNFHRKVLISSTYDTEPSEQLKKSYDYVVRYYKRRSSKLDAHAVEKVARQLIFVNHLFYKNEPFKDAYAILKPHFNGGDLDDRGEEFFYDLSFALGEDDKDFPNL